MKTFQSIITGFVIIAFLVIVVSNCSKENCDRCTITEAEKSFVAYKGSERLVFKNDSSAILDTLQVSITPALAHCSEPCSDAQGSITVSIYLFHHLRNMNLAVYHDIVPYAYPLNSASSDLKFYFNMPVQTVLINSVSYNDVYITSIDSTMIPFAERDNTPWQIYYSKSKGFIRFRMLDKSNWDIM